MKTSLLSAGLVCILFTVRTWAATDVVAGWYTELAAAQQSSHQDAGGRARAEAILRAVFDASRNSPAGTSQEAATSQAAYSTLVVLYPQSRPALDAGLATSLANVTDSAPAIAAGKEWGEHVAQTILGEQSDAVFLNTTGFAEAKAPDDSPLIAGAHAEAGALGPGRYRFSTLAGTPGTKGYADGIGPAARFDNPAAIAVDAAGNVYVSEFTMCTIRKITPAGVASTWAGTAGQSGSRDGAGADARFNGPYGLAVDGMDNVYVVDALNHTVRKIDPAGKVTTLAGKAGEPGRVNGDRETARLNSPATITVDDAGNVFVTERPSNAVSPGFCRITPEGEVSRPSIQAQVDPSFQLFGADYRNSYAYEIAADHAGNIYAINSDFFFSFVDVLKLTPNAAGDYTGKSLGLLTMDWDGKSSDPLKSNWGWDVMGFGVDDDNNLYFRNEFSQIRRYAPGGGAEVHYITGDAGVSLWRAMTADRSGRIFALPAADSGREGIIEIGGFDPEATGPVYHIPSVVQQAPGTTAGAIPTPETAPAASGGGSFDHAFSLAMLALLAAATRRDHRTFAIAAPCHRGRNGPS